MLYNLNIKTNSTTEIQSITDEINNIIKKSGVKTGLCVIYVPHTTAGITINEDADPSVKNDILKELNKVIPFSDGYQHLEGNSAAHIKSTLVGIEKSIIIDNGNLVLGTWQGIFFCEFDGPRNRRVFVKIIETK